MGPIIRNIPKPGGPDPIPLGPRKPDTGPGPCPDDIAGPIFGKCPHKGV